MGFENPECCTAHGNRKLGSTTVVTNAEKDCNTVILEASRHRSIQTSLTYQKVNEDNMESYQKAIIGKHVVPPDDLGMQRKRVKDANNAEPLPCNNISTVTPAIDNQSTINEKKDNSYTPMPPMILTTKEINKRVSFEGSEPSLQECDTITSMSDLPNVNSLQSSSTMLGSLHQDTNYITPGPFHHPTIVKQQHLSNIQCNIFLHTPVTDPTSYAPVSQNPNTFLPFHGATTDYNMVNEQNWHLINEIKELKQDLTKSKEKYEDTITNNKEKYSEAEQLDNQSEKYLEHTSTMKEPNQELKQEIREAKKKHKEDIQHLQAE